MPNWKPFKNRYLRLFQSYPGIRLATIGRYPILDLSIDDAGR